MKNPKLIKKIGAVALAGIMAASFTGCRSQIDKSELENATDKIYLQNEDNMELVVVGFQEIKNSSCESEERYGYFLNDGKNSFYDVLSKDTLDLEIYNDVYDIYYTSFENLLSSEDYVLVKSVGYIDKKYLEDKLENSYYFYKDESTKKYRFSTGAGRNFNYSSAAGYFVDTVKINYEDSEIKKEEPTLEKVK